VVEKYSNSTRSTLSIMDSNFFFLYIKMETAVIALVPVIVKVVTEQLREDLLHMLMGTKCCRWSKRKVRKLYELLNHIEPDIDAIQDVVRRATIIEEDEDPDDAGQFESLVYEYMNKIFPAVKHNITEV